MNTDSDETTSPAGKHTKQFYELRIRFSCAKGTNPSHSIFQFLDEKLKHKMDTVEYLFNHTNYFSAVFTDNKMREECVVKDFKINEVTITSEVFPPSQEQAPFFKPPPKIISTRMRLKNINYLWSLSDIEEALTKDFPAYLSNSATFETYNNNKKIKNGNVSFFVEGLFCGTPCNYFKIKDEDVEI